jgi:hypothetical protein
VFKIEESFKDIFEKYYPKVLNQISWMIKDEFKAEDIAMQQSQVGSLILPTDVIYRKMTAELLTQSSGISFITQGLFGDMSQPSLYMFIYIFFYVIFLLYYGSRHFSQRDL